MILPSTLELFIVPGEEICDQAHHERFREDRKKMVAKLSVTTGIGLKLFPREGHVKGFS